LVPVRLTVLVADRSEPRSRGPTVLALPARVGLTHEGHRTHHPPSPDPLVRWHPNNSSCGANPAPRQSPHHGAPRRHLAEMGDRVRV
jgi:hypothetical protein